MDEGPINVLLADDDEGFLVSLRELVDRQPELSVVATATNGVEAIELADRHDPEAAVIDVHMPILDGVAAIARLRRDHPSMCLIALTADDDRGLHEAVERAGADAVLEKSEMVGALIDRLTNARATVARDGRG
jgi:DNA-binding NarL/FixJ family response regulator